MEETGLIPAGKTMTKVDIVENIYEKVGFPKAEVAKIVESVFDIIKETLQREDKIVVSGFGGLSPEIKRPGEVETRRREVM
jgi:integration host factor subunit alpha